MRHLLKNKFTKHLVLSKKLTTLKCSIFCVFLYYDCLQADDIRALLIDAMPPEALPTCFKPQATVVSASLISPASTPSCLSAASSIDNLTGPLAELAVGGASNTGDGAAGTERKEGEGEYTLVLKSFVFIINRLTFFLLVIIEHLSYRHLICKFSYTQYLIRNMSSQKKFLGTYIVLRYIPVHPFPTAVSY